MIDLILAILTSAMISVTMRVSTDRVGGSRYVLAANYLVCSLLGLLYAGFGAAAAAQPAEVWKTAGLGLVYGILLLTAFIVLQSNIRRYGVVLSSMFMKLGLLVPILLSVLVFGEQPTVLQLAGFALAIGAILLINLKKEGTEGGFGFLLILLLLLGGGADAMGKIYEVYGAADLSGLFLFLSFAFAFALCMATVVKQREKLSLQAVMFGVLIGIPKFFSTQFLLSALTKLPAVVVYPTFSVGSMLLVTLSGVLFFREKPGRRQWIAMAAVIAALILLNI